MGFFNRLKSTTAPKPVTEKEEKKSTLLAEDAVSASPAKTAPVAALLSSPRVSEKAAILSSKGTYVFNVPVTAGKVAIRKAVESQYKVRVVRVNTIRGEGKVVRRGRIEGRRSNWKKALVTLAKGQTIDLHQGV